MSGKDSIATAQPESTADQKKPRKRAQPKPQPEPDNTPAYIEVAPREYDLDLIEDFLDLVFHAGHPNDAEPLLWMVPKHRKPVYPTEEAELFQILEKTKQGFALYYGTASCRRDHTGKLFNRQALFERLHVIVLDDIGTKARAEDLPKALREPTYIIESSEGNYQYGYVLKEPIDNLDAAKALVTLMYEAGIADAGGKMPNKLVRLPEGINGKKGPKCHFVSNLVTMDGPLFTPQELLDALDTGAIWTEIEADATEVTKRRARLKGGSTPWAPYRPTAVSGTQIIDPVAEWLIENGQVIQDGDEWMTVKCPWADQHTSGDDTAGYKPLGRGDDPTSRGFHCFHDSCSTTHTPEYLKFVANLGGPEAGVSDKAADMVATYVYDTINDCAWKIKNTQNPQQITMSGMRNTHPRKALVVDANGKLKPVAEYQQWLTSESRVTVMGPIFDPSTPARLVERGTDLFVNQFAPPAWGKGKYDDRHVEMFKQFLKYLIPVGIERDYFTQWLAAKIQDMGFRGAAIVMVAQVQGVGRSTLADMISTLIGEVNCRNEPFEKIVGEVQFNDWLETPFVVSDETLNTGGLNSYKTYEKLKELIDPRPKLMTINPKYGKQRRSMVHSSFLFLSNHSNALSITADDRRFYVISNPHKPNPKEYFTELNAWLGETEADGITPAWARSVYRWLQTVDVDVEKLLAPPEITAAKLAMLEESRSEIETLANAVLNSWPSEYISQGQFTDMVELFAARVDLYDSPSYKNQLKRIFSAATYALDTGSTLKLDGKTMRFRVIARRATDDTTPKGEPLSGEDKAAIRRDIIPDRIKQITIPSIEEALDLAGL